MILANRKALLAYFNARSLPGLERQFNGDGRRLPVMIDVDTKDREILIATGVPDGKVTVMAFPVHVSDLLGTIERDRIAAEKQAGL